MSWTTAHDVAFCVRFLFWSHIDLKWVVEKGANAGIQLQKI